MRCDLARYLSSCCYTSPGLFLFSVRSYWNLGTRAIHLFFPFDLFIPDCGKRKKKTVPKPSCARTPQNAGASTQKLYITIVAFAVVSLHFFAGLSVVFTSGCWQSHVVTTWLRRVHLSKESRVTYHTHHPHKPGSGGEPLTGQPR
jgi:hypothetical protein